MVFWGKSKNGGYNSDSSSNGSKDNPLLDGSINSGVIIHRHNGRRRKMFGHDDDGGRNCSFCGCMGHILILLLPIVCMAINVAFLAILAAYDQRELQDGEIYGDETYEELAKIYYASVSADSISLVMSQYAPYRDVLALSSVSCILATMVTIARNIQIEAYHKRIGSFVFMKFINYLAALINILAYAGLIVAVNFKVTDEDPEYAVLAHMIGFLSFFGGTATYAVLHSFLLFNQDYPVLIKWLFYLFAVVIVGASLAFGIPIWEGGLDSDEYSDPVYEWVAVFTSAISMGFYFILFFIDPCDNELAAFFCGGQSQKMLERRARRRMLQKEMMETYSV